MKHLEKYNLIYSYDELIDYFLGLIDDVFRITSQSMRTTGVISMKDKYNCINLILRKSNFIIPDFNVIYIDGSKSKLGIIRIKNEYDIVRKELISISSKIKPHVSSLDYTLRFQYDKTYREVCIDDVNTTQFIDNGPYLFKIDFTIKSLII